ncbi:hypothetical protein [Rosistilla oblonga]|uniref:hypothetical protein n=1 Tax=Rosistilla oblonga TaxID=2527990 RepID=UPI003A97AE38
MYNPCYCDSFVLNAIDAQILRSLDGTKGGSADLKTLLDEVSGALDLPVDPQLRQYAEASLAQMMDIGIVCLEATN